MHFDRTTRRLFLKGAGGALLALPLLPSLLPRELRSLARAETPPPRRFVAIKTYSDLPTRDWYPRGSDGTQLAPTHKLDVATGKHRNGKPYYGHWAPLTDFASSGISSIFSDRFNPLHAQMSLLRGLDMMPDLNHNHGGILGNCGLRTEALGGALPNAQINVTIDQIMAQSSAVYATPPPGPRILHLGSRVNTFSYAPTDPNALLATGLDAVQQVQALTSPRAAFDATFAPGGSDVSRRLVDRVIEDYKRASGRKNLSSEDRQQLERVMTHLSELEQRITAAESTAACMQATRPDDIAATGEFDVDVSAVARLWQQHVDIAATALICDTTRIVTLDVSKLVVPDPAGDFGMGDSQNAGAAGRNNWHLEAHAWNDSDPAGSADPIRWLSAGARWVSHNVVLPLLQRLDGASAADGKSILHHSLVLWGYELGFNHLGWGLPTALWGRAGGYLAGGRYIDYVDHDQPVKFAQHDGQCIEGVQYNRFLVTLLQAMGLKPTDYELAPGAGFGESRPIGKTDPNLLAIDYDPSNVGEILPGIRG